MRQKVPQGSPFPVSPSKLMPSPELKLDYRDCLKISVSMAGAGVEGELTQEVNFFEIIKHTEQTHSMNQKW